MQEHRKVQKAARQPSEQGVGIRQYGTLPIRTSATHPHWRRNNEYTMQASKTMYTTPHGAREREQRQNNSKPGAARRGSGGAEGVQHAAGPTAGAPPLAPPPGQGPSPGRPGPRPVPLS